MKKENIYFPIEDQKTIKKVLSLLANFHQAIDEVDFDFYYGENNFLHFDFENQHWFINGSDLGREKITFDDLINILKTEKQYKQYLAINKNTWDGALDELSLHREIRKIEPIELFKKPFRRGIIRKDVILDANGHKVFKLNKGQYSDDLIDKILNSINN